MLPIALELSYRNVLNNLVSVMQIQSHCTLPTKPKTPSRRLSARFLLALTLGSLNTCFADDNQAGKYYEDALIAYRNNNSKEAIINLRNAIQQNQNYVAAHLLLGEIHLQQKSLSEAEAQFDLASQLGADKSLLIKSQAQLYLHQMKYEQLLKNVDPSTFNRDLQPDLYVFRGHAFLQLNKISEAINEYGMAAQINPTLLEPILGKANAFLLRGDIKSAAQEADKAMQTDPKNPGTWYLKATIDYAQNNREEAIKNYDKTIEMAPDHFDARIARAGLLMDLRQDERAKTDLEYIRGKYPAEPNAAYMHAVLLARNNQPEASVKELETAAEIIAGINPEFIVKQPQTLMLAGLVNYSLQRFDIAYDHLNQYVKQYPEHLGVYRLLGSILLDKGEPEKVVDLLKPVLVRNPSDHRLMFLLGTAYMQVGKHDQANTVLQKASALELDDDNVHTELGLNRLIMGQEQLATKELELAIKKKAANAQAGIPLVAMYISQGEPKKALQIAQSLYDKAPNNLTLLNLLGMSQVAAQQKAQARQSFEKAVSINPDFIAAHINLGKLDITEQKADQAKQRLQKLQQKFPDDIAIPLELATVEQITGNFDQAGQWLNKARTLDPKSLPAVLALIDLKLTAGKATEALSLALSEEPNFLHNMPFHEALARSYLATGSKDNAINIFRLMSQEARFNTKKLYKIAGYQMGVGDYAEVIKTLKKAVMGDETHLPSQVALVEMELNYGTPAFASSRAQNLVKQYPDQAFGYRLLGDIAAHERNIAQAANHYQTAFDKQPDTILLMKLYQTLKQSKQDGKAYTLLEQWLKKHPKDELPIAAFAEEHLQAGRLKDAQKYYESLLEIHPNQPQWLNNLAYIYFNTGNGKALSFAEQAQKLAPEQASSNDTLGWILVNNGQVEQGLHFLRNAQSRTAQDPEIHYHIAVALDRLQRKEEAKMELELALKSNTPFNGMEQAKTLLEKLRR